MDTIKKLQVENNKLRETLRDQFAMAYAPVCSIEEFTPEGAAEQCIRFADAMLKAREESK